MELMPPLLDEFMAGTTNLFKTQGLALHPVQLSSGTLSVSSRKMDTSNMCLDRVGFAHGWRCISSVDTQFVIHNMNDTLPRPSES